MVINATLQKCIFAITIFSSFKLSAQEYDSLPSAPREKISITSTTYYLTLSVNGRVDNQVIPVLYHNGHYMVEAGALTRNYIRLGKQRTGLIDLNTLPAVKTEYDSIHQQLNISVPSDWLSVQYITDDSIFNHISAVNSPGMLFNYDAYYLKSYGGFQSLSTLVEPRLLSNYGYITSTGVYRHAISGKQNDLEDGYFRYDTYWHYSDEDSMVSYQLGDIISGSMTWNNSVRIGGLRVSRNFSVRPDLVTYPLLQYTGTSTVPSSVDLFINGYKASSNLLNAGPYTLTSVPYINGSGEATVITTDALGRSIVTTIPFYVSNILLRQGLSDFDISLGFLRKEYGTKNDKYSNRASSLIYRYGLNNSLTLSGHTELSDGLTMAGLGSDMAVGRWGTLSNSYSLDVGKGQRYTVGYTYYSHLFSVAVQHIQRTSNFQDLSTFRTKAQLSKRSDQVTFSTAPFGKGNGTIGVGYFDIQAYDNNRTQLANLSYSRSLWGKNNLNLSFNKTLGVNGYSAQLQFIIPFGKDYTASIQSQRNTNGKYVERFGVSKPVPSYGGTGWNLNYSTGNSKYRQADMTWKTSDATLQGGVYGEGEKNNYWGDLNGSIVYMGSSLFLSNKINDSFIVVSTNGYSDVPVRYENRLIGKTNNKGYMLIPSVNGYYPAKLEIDTLSLPVDTSAEVIEKKVAVRGGSGTLISLPVKKAHSATIRLVDENGSSLPVGSYATEIHSGQGGIVGYDGLVFFNNLPRENTVSVQLLSGKKCSFSFTLPERTHAPYQLGVLTCRPEAVAAKEGI